MARRRWRGGTAHGYAALGAGVVVALVSMAVPTAALWRDDLNVGKPVKIRVGVAGFRVESTFEDSSGDSLALVVDTSNGVAGKPVVFDGPGTGSALLAAPGRKIAIPFTVESHADGNIGVDYTISVSKDDPSQGQMFQNSNLYLRLLDPNDPSDVCEVSGDPEAEPGHVATESRVWSGAGVDLWTELDAVSSDRSVSVPLGDERRDEWCLQIELDPLFVPTSSGGTIAYSNNALAVFEKGDDVRYGVYDDSSPWCALLERAGAGSESDLIVTISPTLYRVR